MIDRHQRATEYLALPDPQTLPPSIPVGIETALEQRAENRPSISDQSRFDAASTVSMSAFSGGSAASSSNRPPLNQPTV